MAQSLWCSLGRAIHVVQSMRCTAMQNNATVKQLKPMQSAKQFKALQRDADQYNVMHIGAMQCNAMRSSGKQRK